MGLFKLIRKVAGIIRGGVGFGQLVLGCMLGFFIGMIPGFNLLSLVLLFLLLLFNTNRFLGAVMIIVGSIFSVIVAPVTFRMGFVIIHQVGLEGLFAWFAELPVVAWFGLDNYCLVGGIPVVIVVGGALSWWLARTVIGIRKAIVSGKEKSTRFKKVAENKIVRFFVNLVLGKQKKTMEQLTTERQPMFRKAGLVLAGLLVLLVVVFDVFFADEFARIVITRQGTRAVGAEVNLVEVDLSITDGRIVMTGLQVTDPARPTHNSFQAERLEGNFSYTDLLRKRIVVSQVTVTDARTDAPRKSPGAIYRKPPPPEDEDADWDILDDYLKDTEKLKETVEKLKKVGRWLREKMAEQDAEDEQKEEGWYDVMKRRAEEEGWRSLTAQHILTEHPAWVIEKVDVERVRAAESDLVYDIRGRELSSSPALHPKPMTVTVTRSDGMDVNVALRLFPGGGANSLRAIVPNIPLGRAVKLDDDAGVNLEDGRANVAVEGTFGLQAIDLPVLVQIVNLKANAEPGKTVLGMKPEQARQVFEHLKEMKIGAALKGTFMQPRLELSEKQMLESIKAAMVQAGRQRLVSEIDSRLKDQLGDKVPGDIPSGIGDILKGRRDDQKDDPKKDDEKTDNKKPDPGKIIDLFK